MSGPEISEAEKKWRLDVRDLAELIKIVAQEGSRYPEDSKDERAVAF
jgi:hypothetical protein